MKISSLDSFPWPVLRDNSDDYSSGAFTVTIESAENMKTGALSIRYSMKTSEDYIASLITEGLASRALCITCLETFYNQVKNVTLSDGVIEIEKGQLSGTVNILPVVVLTNDIDEFYSNSFHAEFGTESLQLKAGALLAIGDVYRINVGREKLAPIESIFSIDRLDTVSPGRFQVSLEFEKITIQAEKTTYNFIHLLRNTGYGQNILLNSVYQPALMEALYNVSQDDSAYSDRRWFKVFSAKCTHLDINPDTPNLLADTQKMFKTPFNRLFSLQTMLE